MADEVTPSTDEMTAELAAEIGEQGTLASIQARIPKMRFDPNTETMREEPPEEEPPLGTEPEGETPEEKTAREAAEAEEAAKAEAASKGQEEKPPKKYRNRVEAEKAANEASRKMHEATEETAREKAAREAAEKKAADALKENQELKKQLDAAKAAKPEEKPSKAAADDSAIEAATEEALTEISKLTPPVPGDEEAEIAHRKAAAKIWSKALKTAGISGISKDEVAQLVADTIKAREEAAKPETPSSEDVWEKAISLGKEGGLNLAPGTEDFRYFRDIAEHDLPQQEFMKAEKDPTLKEQVEWVVAEVKKAKAAARADLEKEKGKTRRVQTLNTPLTRGATSPAKPETTESTDRPSYTMADIQAGIVERARAKHRGA